MPPLLRMRVSLARRTTQCGGLLSAACLQCCQERARGGQKPNSGDYRRAAWGTAAPWAPQAASILRRRHLGKHYFQLPPCQLTAPRASLARRSLFWLCHRTVANVLPGAAGSSSTAARHVRRLGPCRTGITRCGGVSAGTADTHALTRSAARPLCCQPGTVAFYCTESMNSAMASNVATTIH